MERQINTLCNFTLGFIMCQLPEDTVDVQVRVRTHRGTHTLKKDCQYCSLQWDIDQGADYLARPAILKQRKPSQL